LPIGETTRIPGVELSPEAPVHPRELPREVISDPWLEPVGEINRSIEFPTNSNRSPYAEISDPWSNCFVAGTKIWTINGEKNIEDIKVGDWVLSDDPNTPGEVIYKQVLQTFEKETGTTINIFIDGEKITTTEEHPFWVPDVGWVLAKDLNVGTHLQTKTESWLDVDKVDKHIELTKVYNFEVEGFHTYFVSDLGFLVHNICNGSRKLEVFRANDRGLENRIFDETGFILSDAAQQRFAENGGNLADALAHARQVHQEWLKIFGSPDNYARMHSARGTEFPTEFGLPRTLISVTDNSSQLSRFGDTHYQGILPKSTLIHQTLPGAGEGEFLIPYGTNGLIRIK
jgi:hypothetical protein